MRRRHIMQFLRSSALSAALVVMLILSITTLVVFPTAWDADPEGAPAKEEEAPARASMSADGYMIHCVESAAQQTGAALQRLAQVFFEAYKLDHEAPSTDASVSDDGHAHLPVVHILSLLASFPQGP